MTLQPGESATYSIWLRLGNGVAAAGQSVNVCLWSMNASPPASSCISGAVSGQWQHFQTTATMPVATTTLRAQVYMTGSGDFNFDDAVVGYNLLRDGGFEGGGGSWGIMPASAGAVTNYAVYATPNGWAHDGVRYGEANTSVDAGSLYQDVPVVLAPGDSATFSIWVKIGNATTATGQWVNVCLWSLDASPPRSACIAAGVTGQRQQLQTTATMPVATTTLRAQIYMSGRGNIDFDGGVLTRNLLRDGGFEGGGAAWAPLPPAPGVVVNYVPYSTPNGFAHDGGWYGEANSAADSGSIYQDVLVTLQAGESMTLSTWARLDDGNAPAGQHVNVCVWSMDASPPAGACAQRMLTNGWQPVQTTLTMPIATTSIRAQIYMIGRGNFDFDGASMGAPHTAEPLAPPPGGGSSPTPDAPLDPGPPPPPDLADGGNGSVLLPPAGGGQQGGEAPRAATRAARVTYVRKAGGVVVVTARFTSISGPTAGRCQVQQKTPGGWKSRKAAFAPRGLCVVRVRFATRGPKTLRVRFAPVSRSYAPSVSRPVVVRVRA